MQSSEPIIQLVGLGKEFSTSNGSIVALDNINLTICQGEIFGIIGLSGAGKSTLVRCINYLEVPTSGKVLFENKSLSEMKPKQQRKARQSMGMIFQQFNLLAQRNVIQNICFPLEIAGVAKKDARKRAEELLALVGLEDRAKAYPSQLSGGQKQRVAIARALATNPKILLCDEATSALDPNTTKSILGLLKEINKNLGVTVVVITHEMTVIEAICDKVAIIDQSHIAEEGTVADIFSEPKSRIGRQLILGDAADQAMKFGESRRIRISFDGRSSFEPVIANMILACKTAVNIIHAETRDINGTAMGQMVIQLPQEELDANRIINYLKTAKVTFDAATMDMLKMGIWETLYMVFYSSFFAYLIGIPLGIILIVTDKDGIRPFPWLQKILGLAINLLRSVPFIILLIMVLPLTKQIVGTTLGSKAVIVPLVIAAAPYVARVVESSFKEVDAGVIEAAKSMGASTFQIVWKVLLPEAKPSLLIGAALAITTILGYSAMSGFVGGGGLGDIAIKYGYYRYQTQMMFVTVVILVIIVQIIQEAGMKLARISDKRIR